MRSWQGWIWADGIFWGLGLQPQQAGLPTLPLSTLSYVGTLQILTKHGTITTNDVGVSDEGTRVFSEFDTIVGGTGRFANASGSLFNLRLRNV
jgi:hypothetical protein